MILSFGIVKKSEFVLRIQSIGRQLTLAPFIPLPSQLLHREPYLFCCVLSNESPSYLHMCLVVLRHRHHCSSAVFLFLILVPLWFLQQLGVCPFLHARNSKWLNFAVLPLIPVTVLGPSGVRTDRQAKWEDLASPLAAGHPLLLSDRRRVCWEEKREWFYVS